MKGGTEKNRPKARCPTKRSVKYQEIHQTPEKRFAHRKKSLKFSYLLINKQINNQTNKQTLRLHSGSYMGKRVRCWLRDSITWADHVSKRCFMFWSIIFAIHNENCNLKIRSIVLWRIWKYWNVVKSWGFWKSDLRISRAMCSRGIPGRHLLCSFCVTMHKLNY